MLPVRYLVTGELLLAHALFALDPDCGARKVGPCVRWPAVVLLRTVYSQAQGCVWASCASTERRRRAALAYVQR